MASREELFVQAVKEGRLEVTENGRVKHTRTGQWLGGTSKRRRYRHVTLTFDGAEHTIDIHRLVYLIFHGPIPAGYTVNHKDGDRYNNRPRNLEAGPHRDNIRHSFQNGLQPPFKYGEENQSAKLADTEVLAIKQKRAEGKSCRSIAKEHGVSHQLVSMICNGKRRKVK